MRCFHALHYPDVSKLRGGAQNSACQKLVSGNACSFYTRVQNHKYDEPKVYDMMDIEDLCKHGQQHHVSAVIHRDRYPHASTNVVRKRKHVCTYPCKHCNAHRHRYMHTYIYVYTYIRKDILKYMHMYLNSSALYYLNRNTADDTYIHAYMLHTHKD
jgi:hypothetical protein